LSATLVSRCGQAYYQSRDDLTPFSDDIQLRWIWGYSLTERRPLLVPLQLAFYGEKITGEPRIVHDNSNGCASGSCLEEAILFALLELIERDAFMIHWNLRLSPPQIDTSTLIDQNLRFLIDRLARQNCEVYLLDTRLDLRVPSIAALVVRRNNQLGTLTVATGSSFNPEDAMASALAEASDRQVGFEYRTRSSENRIRQALLNFRLVRSMEDHGALYGIPEAMKYAEFLLESRVKLSVQEAYWKWRSDVPQTLDLLDDIQHCIQLLASTSLKQVIAVDQSSPEGLRVGLRTARVLVPGLVPLDFGYGSSRALSLPRMHRLAQNVQAHQDQLNRAPHPFS
jgi:ribosomal protein S12 methylthiotransferase accessory factor